jgi:hypothetical protein
MNDRGRVPNLRERNVLYMHVEASEMHGARSTGWFKYFNRLSTNGQEVKNQDNRARGSWAYPMVVALQLLCWIGVLVLAPLPEQAAPLWPLLPLLGCSLRCPETAGAWRDELRQCKPLPLPLPQPACNLTHCSL